jgi:prolyl oligopeptidase
MNGHPRSTTAVPPYAPKMDRYRWLEERHSDATKLWIADQDTRTKRYFRALEDLEQVRARVTHWLDVESIQQLVRVGEHYFFLRRKTGQEQPCICMTDLARSSDRVLFDPNTSPNRFVSAQIYAASATGELLAYKVRHGGEHSCAVEIVRTRTGGRCSRLLRGEARGLVFSENSDGFFYCQECPHDGAAHEIRFRQLEDSRPDRVVLRLPRSAGSRLNVLGEDSGPLFALHYRREFGRRVTDLYLAHANGRDWQRVIKDSEDSFAPALHQDRIFLLTYEGARNGTVVELASNRLHDRIVIVPECAHRIHQLCLTRDRIFVGYLVELDPLVEEWSLSGDSIGSLPVQPDETITFCTPVSSHCDELFYVSESFTRPPEIHCYHPHNRNDNVWHKDRRAAATTPGKSQRVSYSSTDGTTVLMYVVNPNESIPGESRPTVMTAYGGFGAMMTPRFSVFVSILQEMGFRFALPLIRGGGEWGPAWHDAAKRRLRGKSIEDFLSAADWLIEEGLTSADRLAIFGGSHSGLLVSAAMTRRPELFGAVLAIAPLTDMLRYHLFDGAAKWTSEYGSAEDPGDFAALASYSPYHNVQEETNYPPSLFVCGDQDTTCNAAHSRKMVAQLQNQPAQQNPILLDHMPERGHSPHLPLSTRIEALARRIAFLCHELDIEFPLERTP